MAVTAVEQVSSREAVLEAARSLIIEHGYAGLSMRELAKHSGIAKATIYHHFQHKRDVYLRVLERDVLVVRDRLVQAAASPGDHRDKLRSVIHTYFALQHERRFVLMSALREAAGLEAELCDLLRIYRSELIKPIGAIIANGIAQGTIRPVNVEMTVISLLGMLHSFVTHRIVLDRAAIGEDVVDHVLDLVLIGITAVPADAQGSVIS